MCRSAHCIICCIFATVSLEKPPNTAGKHIRSSNTYPVTADFSCSLGTLLFLQSLQGDCHLWFLLELASGRTQFWETQFQTQRLWENRQRLAHRSDGCTALSLPTSNVSRPADRALLVAQVGSTSLSSSSCQQERLKQKRPSYTVLRCVCCFVAVEGCWLGCCGASSD